MVVMLGLASCSGDSRPLEGKQSGTSPPASSGRAELALLQPRAAVVALRDGRVALAGGQHINVYDPADNTMTVLRNPVLPRRSFVAATPVGRSTVLVAGRYDAIVPTADAQLVRITGAVTTWAIWRYSGTYENCWSAGTPSAHQASVVNDAGATSNRCTTARGASSASRVSILIGVT